MPISHTRAFLQTLLGWKRTRSKGPNSRAHATIACASGALALFSTGNLTAGSCHRFQGSGRSGPHRPAATLSYASVVSAAGEQPRIPALDYRCHGAHGAPRWLGHTVSTSWVQYMLYEGCVLTDEQMDEMRNSGIVRPRPFERMPSRLAVDSVRVRFRQLRLGTSSVLVWVAVQAIFKS